MKYTIHIWHEMTHVEFETAFFRISRFRIDNLRDNIGLIFSALSMFWKTKSMVMRSRCSLHVSLPSTFECLNQSLWNSIVILAHLNGELNKSLPSVCVSLLGNGLVNMFPRQRIHNNREIIGRVIFCTARLVSKETVHHLSLLGNGSLNTFPLRRRMLEASLLCGPCCMKGK
jgi:hypothetical protein